MPANLTPQYLAAEKRYKEAVTPQEKIEALEEMMAVMPKHKGTEKLQADLKHRLAKLRVESERKHGPSKGSTMHVVPKEGAGQAVLVGAPNVGKSSLLARLTKATPEIGDYPFTTRMPQPGMMPFENIQIQIIDLPPIALESYEPWIGGIVRQADLALMVVDLSSDELLEEVDSVLKILEGSRIRLIGSLPVENDDNVPAVISKKTFLVANKSDSPNARDNLTILREFFEKQFPIFTASTVTNEGLEPLRHAIFESLEVIRIYTKPPGKKVDLSTAPFVLKIGSTVLDAARAVHRDFENTLKFARVWSSARSKSIVKFDGQMVERAHHLEDGDILELHM
ncbi:MAG: 50S ribosome-binding GTPase [Acidobacteriia bacterium]|nr:50S ribosome-binding GTPase [Terriglobia bacterium]